MSAPVELTVLGLTDDKDYVRYKIQVNTDRPISQVDLAASWSDASGAPQKETLIWQNVVGSTKKPIEQGKSYEDSSYLGPDTVKYAVKVAQVIFADKSVWKP